MKKIKKDKQGKKIRLQKVEFSLLSKNETTQVEKKEKQKKQHKTKREKLKYRNK